MPRRRPKLHPADIKAAERDAQVTALLLQGLRPPAVARALGITRQTAYKAMLRAFARLKDENAPIAAAARDLCLARYDRLIQSHWPAAQEDPAVAQLIIRLEESKRKLLGIDAADKHELAGPDGAPLHVQHGLSDDMIECIKRDVLGI
jgi:DNA-binding CsgD family transcriptional regulator